MVAAFAEVGKAMGRFLGQFHARCWARVSQHQEARRHIARCRTCNPRGNPRPLPVDGHAYRRRRRARARRRR